MDTAKFCPKCGSNSFQDEAEQVTPVDSGPISPPPRAPVAPPRFTREPVKPVEEDPPPPVFAPKVVVEDAPLFAPKTVETQKSDTPTKTSAPSSTKKGGNKGILVVGILGLVAVGGYFIFSQKDAPNAVVTPAPTQSQSAPPAQPAPAPVVAPPAKSAPVAPKAVVTPKSNPGTSSPAPASTPAAPAAPDINKIMKDAASK